MTERTAAALRTARAQCLIRVTQLAGCRVCGADQQRFAEAVAVLDDLLRQLEAGAAVLVPPQGAATGPK